MASENLLLIFTRNPVLGKCKTRLAATIGDGKALEVYKFLLNHTMGITTPLPVNKIVYYSETILQDDLWNPKIFNKELQSGGNLGERMLTAFKSGFQQGYKRIILIGSDVYDLNTKDLETAFSKLTENDAVLGPAEDGGYYLIGMTEFIPEVFKNKEWGTSSVLKATLNDLKDKRLELLEPRNDVDLYEDIKNIPAFRPFLIDLNL